MPINEINRVSVAEVEKLNSVLASDIESINGVTYPASFIFSIDTSLGDGTVAFQLPLSGTVNFTVDWGDGNSDTITSDTDPAMDHTYASGGTYDIVLKGTIGNWNTGTTSDRTKVTDVKQWGINFTSGTFQNFTNLTGDTATGNPFVNVLSNFYSGCSTFNGDITDWDVSGVALMNAMFSDALVFNQDISSWNVGSVLSMSGMFNDAALFNQNIGGWDISSVVTCSFMLSGSGLSTANYDALLIGWAAQAPDIQSNVTLSTGPQRTNASLAAYNTLTSATYGWNISDGGLI